MITLTGNWAGNLTDSRPEYSKRAEILVICVAVEKSPGVWSCVFNVGEKVFKVGAGREKSGRADCLRYIGESGEFLRRICI